MHPSSGDGGEHVPLSHQRSAAAPTVLSRGTPSLVSATPGRLGIGWAWSQLIGKEERQAGMQAWVQESEEEEEAQ